MKSRVAGVVAKGVVCGAIVGFLIGSYVVTLSKNRVVRHDDFSHPVTFQQAQDRYAATVLFAFVSVFAFIGPFFAAASFGPWIRHAVFGFTGVVALVVAGTLLAAAVTNQQPFNRNKVSESTCIDVALTYLLPAAVVVGPVAGLLIGTLRKVKGHGSQ